MTGEQATNSRKRGSGSGKARRCIGGSLGEISSLRETEKDYFSGFLEYYFSIHECCGLNAFDHCSLVSTFIQCIFMFCPRGHIGDGSPPRGCRLHLPLCSTALEASRQPSKRTSPTDKSLRRRSVFLFWCEIPPSSEKAAAAAASGLICFAESILSQSLPVHLCSGCFRGF